MKKKIHTIVNTFAIIILLTSCATRELWKKNKYPEIFREYLLTENQDKVVILGKKYNYVFLTDSTLRKILNWKDKNLLRITFYKATVAEDNTAIGSYNISVLYNNVSTEQRDWLESNGFKFKTAENMYLYYKANIKGQRVEINNNEIHNDEFPINYPKNLAIGIKEGFSNIEKAPRLLVSPITIAIDSVFILIILTLDGLSSHHPISTNPF